MQHRFNIYECIMVSRSLNYVSYPWVMLVLYSLYSLLATSGNCLVSLDSLVASSVINLTTNKWKPIGNEGCYQSFCYRCNCCCCFLLFVIFCKAFNYTTFSIQWKELCSILCVQVCDNVHVYVYVMVTFCGQNNINFV